MKKSILVLALSICIGAVNVQANITAPKHPKKVNDKKANKFDKDDEHYMKAIRLINTADGGCAFEIGKIPTSTYLDVSSFWGQRHIDKYEKVAHAAPRMQYVVTLKGKLKFTVSDGSTFMLEPGVILVAEDTKGKGHTWDMVKGKTWERLYIPIAANGDDHFIKKD